LPDPLVDGHRIKIAERASLDKGICQREEGAPKFTKLCMILHSEDRKGGLHD
jgi:hypothetical protein